MKDEREALLDIRRTITDAMRPDSGATVTSLLSDVSCALTKAGMDPMAEEIDCGGLDAGSAICNRDPAGYRAQALGR